MKYAMVHVNVIDRIVFVYKNVQKEIASYKQIYTDADFIETSNSLVINGTDKDGNFHQLRVPLIFCVNYIGFDRNNLNYT